MKKDLQSRVDETMKSFDGLQRAEANSYLWSKIRNRMQDTREFVPQNLAWRMVAALVVVALLNILTISHFSAGGKSLNGAESVANEYAISLPQTY